MADNTARGVRSPELQLAELAQSNRDLDDRVVRFAEMLDHFPGAAYRCRNDSAYTMEFVSAGIETLTGYAAAGFLAGDLAFGELIVSEDRDILLQAVQSALRERCAWDVRYRIRTASGDIKSLWERGHGIAETPGDATMLEGFIVDVTDHQRAEEALSDNASRLRLALGAARMGTWDWDLATGHIIWSGNHEELWAMPRGSFKGTFAEFNSRVHAEDRAALNDAVQAALVNRTEYNCEYRIVWPNGQVRWMAGRGHGIYDTDGEPLRMIGIVMDVTERREAEAIREGSQLQLRDSEHRMRGILDSMFAFVGLFSTDGILLEANRAPLEAAGLEKATVIGKPVVDTLWINHSPRTQAQLASAIARAAQGETVRQDLDIRVADGSLIVLDTTLGPLRDATGKVTQVVGSGVDVTARKQAEAIRQKLETQLWQAQKMEALGTLAGGVAHDFNNLLNVIIGNAELAHQDLGERHPASGGLDEIRMAGRRAKSIVQQILAYSRKQPLQRRVLSLDAIVKECAAMLRATLPSTADLKVICDPAPNVSADATQIHQVLLNLVTNALHSLPEDAQRRGQVVLRLRGEELTAQAAADYEVPKGTYAVLAVTDNGGGIDEAMQSRIFEPFFTTKGAGKGTGLGLAVVDGIVRAHGGCVIVESSLGMGSTFKVLLPAANENESYGLPPAATPMTRGRRQYILYLDDDAALVSLAVKMLERANYHPVGFTDAATALDAVRANPFQFAAAITDHTMPGASGLQVARLMLAIRPDLRVALVSGYVTEDLRQRALEAGVQLVASKPDNSEDLCSLVEQALKGQK